MANCGSLALISRTDNQFVNFFKKPGIILTVSLVMQYIKYKNIPIFPCYPLQPHRNSETKAATTQRKSRGE